MINFWSYQDEYRKYKKDILKRIDNSLKKGSIFFGEELIKFEKNFVKKYNSKYGIAVGSGTDAILLSLKSLTIGRGDEVITAANTAIPTISAIINSGAKPVLVDCGDDYLIDTNKIEKEINSKTKAIIPVHLYGQMCEMDKIIEIAKRNKISIIEDCAQSQGAKYKKKYAGTFGKLGCFSFYPTKILGAYGDGGFILTNDYGLFKKIKRLRFYGIETISNTMYKDKYYANENGFNSRIDELQISILNFKLKMVNSFIKKRKILAKIYLDNLSSTSLKLPYENENNQHSYHLFTVYHPKREYIIKKLKKNNIETRVIYPYPIQNMNAYKKLVNNRSSLQKSETLSKGIFSLPLYPELTIKKVMLVCKILKKIIKKNNF
jgi:aminotransferase EvaB